jgi:hypothetical protein
MNNFKGFASKVREQARDAAKKLPSFDDMAATDEYIHSEEFNVTGQTKSKEEELSKQSKISESDHSSTWSLIDRRIQNSSLPPSSNSSFADPEAPKVQNDNLAESQRREEPTPEPPPPLQKKPLVLSVVTDAMREQQNAPEVVESESDVSEEHSDDDSWSEEDEEDPILSMIRSNKREELKSLPRTKRSKQSSKTTKDKRNPNRFLEELDWVETQTVEGTTSNQQTTVATTPSIPATSRELGSWMKTLASNQVNKLLRRQEPKPSSTGMPPLAKNKPQSKSNQQQEDEYHSADSKNLLGDNELAQLAKMKHANKGSLSLLMDSVYENRQFAFIFFTLILAALVYFYSYRQIEEGVM